MNDLNYQMLDDEQQYQAGVDACKRGDKCPHNATSAYIAGYGDEYALEQTLSGQEQHYVTNSH